MRSRYVYLLILAILLVMLPIQVFAETTYDKDLETVILKVKELLFISDNYDTFDSKIDSNQNGVYFYLSWSDSKMSFLIST